MVQDTLHLLIYIYPQIAKSVFIPHISLLYSMHLLVRFYCFYVLCIGLMWPMGPTHSANSFATINSDSDSDFSHPGIKISISWARWDIWAPIDVKVGTDPGPRAPQGGPQQGRALRPFPSCSSMTSSCLGGPLGAIEPGSARPSELQDKLTQQLLIRL